MILDDNYQIMGKTKHEVNDSISLAEIIELRNVQFHRREGGIKTLSELHNRMRYLFFSIKVSFKRTIEIKIKSVGTNT